MDNTSTSIVKYGVLLACDMLTDVLVRHGHCLTAESQANITEGLRLLRRACDC